MSSIPISKTKIIPPRRRAEILTRKRLLDILFESLDKKLILVSAPAGYGKTSLLIDFAHQSELACCWLALDEMDREPQRFIAYLIAAMTERFPNFGGQSMSMLGSLTSLEQDMERMLVTLVNETYEQIHEHFILVLDDFHLVDEVHSIQAFLDRFIQLVDENCHVIISSRVLTSLPSLPLMVAREQVSGLSFSDLAFHADEFQALLLQNKNLQVSDDEAQKMIIETEGWITGLQFLGADALSSEFIKPSSNTGIGLFDFLGQQVLDRQSPALRDFLLRTSVLDEFDASLCQSVLAPLYPKPQNWQSLISEVVQNNIFVLPVGADGRWLRYHHLFRDFLRTRFEQEHPEEVKPILSRMARAYEDLDEWEKAHHLYKQFNDNDILAEMIERSGVVMLRRDYLTLASWLNDLAPSALRTRPGLLAIRGAISCIKGNLNEGLSLLNQAEQVFRLNNDMLGLILTLARRAIAYRFLGNYDASLHDAAEVIQLTGTSDEFETFYAEALRVKGLALYRLGRARESVEVLEHSLNIYIRLNDVASIPVLLMETGMVYRAVGSYTDAGIAYEKALQVWRKEGNLSWQASLLNNMGGMYHVQGEYEKAAVAFEEGLLCALRSRYTRLNALLSIGLGDMYAELEDFGIAQQNYQQIDDIVREMGDSFLLHSLIFARASLALLQNNVSDAQKMINKVAAAIQSGNSLYEKGLLNLILGRLALLTEKPSQAITRLEESECCFAQDGRELETGLSRIWLAAAHHQAGNSASSRQMIKSLLGGRSQVPHALLVAIHQSRYWLDGLQKDVEVGRIVGDLLTRSNRLASKIPTVRRQLRRMARVVEVPNPHLIIQALGQTMVRVGGKLLTLSDWQTQSVRDLLFYFLTSTKPLTKEQVGETLWPDLSDPQKLKLRFKNEVYRLRRAVGQDVIVYDDVFYMFNRSLDYEYDVEAFASFLDKARSLVNPEEQIEFYQKAVDLVRGPFLADIFADWAMLERERLNQIYLSALLTLANLFQKQAQLEKALVISQRAVEYEPTFEEAYCLSMQIYKRLGDRNSIIRIYQTCRDALQRRLDLPPSQETEALYRSLIA